MRRFQLVSFLFQLVLIGGTTRTLFAFLPPTQSSSPAGALSRPFAARHIPKPPVTTIPSSSTARHAIALPNWEEVMYHAQSMAGSLAATTLAQDPSNLVTSLPIMYAAGLLTSCSPCVWGLLPLTMSYISTAAGERQDQQTTWPTLAFAAGLAMVFCSLGVAAAELGGVFGGSSNTDGADWIAVISNGVCFLMGLKLLELIDLPLLNLQALDLTKQQKSANNNEPILLDATGRTVNKENNNNNNNKSSERGSLFRTFLLGGSSALVASPCATPVLTSILAFVATAHNASLGAALLLGYTLGYSTPLLWIASTGGQALVKLKQNKNNGMLAAVVPWVTPLTGGILLWYGTTGLLTALWGDPSLAGLAPILE